MYALDAVSDALNKILDKAQQLAPTVWEAALHQVAINARMSFMWGVGWTVVAALFALIGLGIPVVYLHERKQFRQVRNALVAIERTRGGNESIIPYETRQMINYNGHPNEVLPFTAWASVVAWIVVVLCGILAVSSFWNAWQMSQNPTWWAIQLIKG